MVKPGHLAFFGTLRGSLVGNQVDMIEKFEFGQQGNFARFLLLLKRLEICSRL